MSSTTIYTPILVLAGIMTLGGFMTLAGAEGLPKQSVLPLALAEKAAVAAMEKCASGGYKVSVAVVDLGGNLKVLLRDDGAGPHTVDSSSRKAYTSASLRRPTEHLAQLLTKFPSIEGLRDMNEKILILGGGLPIEIQGEVVGGIGVGGAPGAHLDEGCATAGVQAIGGEMKGVPAP
ncbi:heme-binding protein [Candidatus Nitronereus thalassa]|uniref:Heme-binding protein n=1 Tax=Candidatus Nitronereus thalassa TaxID=3020898 RepID=A0ABU3K9K4_9BACT|nr:heme-binding protein [Candidatus Nitronereus thalassa]MDT7043092.1 heme-binding protein [Candidatus Nitronereus thalassa]